MNKKRTRKSLEVLSMSATKSTVKTANSACFLWQYQPKESEKIKKLRKF